MKRYLPSNLNVDASLLSEFNEAAGQRTDNVVQLTNPKQQLQPAAFQSLMSGQKGRVDSLLTGTPLSKFYPFESSILDNFRTKNTHAWIPQALPNRQLTANFTTPITRVVKPYTSTLDAVSRFEIAFEYRDDPNKMDTFLAPHIGHIQGSPMCILNASTLNHALFQQQMSEAKRDYEDYLLRTPWDYWGKWSVGGIVETESMLNGSESEFSSGISSRGSGGQTSGGYKIVTITSKGPQFLYNVFGSNIKPGGKCYAIFKKCAIPSQYYLDNKPNLAALSGRHTVNRTPLINNVPHIIKPYQVSFLCLPNGGPLPREATMYRDERDILRYDGVAIYLGRIFSTPIDHVFREVTNYFDIDPITKRVIDSGANAYNDAREGIDGDSIMLMKLILDADDGISSF